MLIRFASSEDKSLWQQLADTVAEVFESPNMAYDNNFINYMDTKISKNEALIAVDRMSGECLGIIGFSRNNNRISWFAVAEQYRNKGIGTRLLSTALRQLDNTKNITIDTFCEDYLPGKSARAVYKKAGFIESEIFINELGNRRSLMILKPDNNSLNKKLLSLIKSSSVFSESKEIKIEQIKREEDNSFYEVWLITADKEKYILKKAKEYEAEIYSNFLSENIKGACRLIKSINFESEVYLLIEYAEGESLLKAKRENIVKALDALISLQNHYWQNEEKATFGFTYEKSLEKRLDRGKYLCDPELEKAYGKFIEIYKETPKTFCHEDLLPFNILVNKIDANIIDWEIAGILPYPLSLARLLAHTEEHENAFFFMKEEDKLFAIDYYYNNLLKDKGIKYDDFLNTFNYFIFYEYCEWIMLYNKYEDGSKEMFDIYYNKAKNHLKLLK